MDAPRPAVRFSEVIVEIRALGRRFVAVFRFVAFSVSFQRGRGQVVSPFFSSTVCLRQGGMARDWRRYTEYIQKGGKARISNKNIGMDDCSERT